MRLTHAQPASSLHTYLVDNVLLVCFVVIISGSSEARLAVVWRRLVWKTFPACSFGLPQHYASEAGRNMTPSQRIQGQPTACCVLC